MSNLDINRIYLGLFSEKVSSSFNPQRNINAVNEAERKELSKRLISGAMVLDYFADRGLNENELIEIITNPRARTNAVRSGLITKKERDRLIAQAQPARDITEYTPDPFGQDQSEYLEYGPDEGDQRLNDQDQKKLKDAIAYFEDEDPQISKARKKRDPGLYSELKLRQGDKSEVNDRYRANAPESFTRDVINRLQTQAAYNRPGGSEVLVDRLLRTLGDAELKADPRLQLEAQKALSRDLVLSERNAGLYNQVTALKNAALGNQGAIDPIIARNLNRIPELTNLGGAGSLAPFGMYRTVPQYSAEDLKAPYELGNVPDSLGYQVQRGPEGMSALDFVINATQDNKMQGRTMGVYPQVNIAAETGQLLNRIRGNKSLQSLGISPQAENLRSIDELQTILNVINTKNAKRAYNEREKFSTPIPKESGGFLNVPTSRVGALELMNKLNMTTGEQERLATALFQIEAGRRTSVNQASKNAYIARDAASKVDPNKGLVFNAPYAMLTDRPVVTDQLANIQGIGNVSKIDLKSQFRNLSNEMPDAQKPYIGLLKENQANQKTYKLRGNYKSPEEETPRGPIRTRINNMDRLNTERARRANTSTPMTRDEYVSRIQDTREKQLKNYVAQVRASRDQKRRTKLQQDIAYRRGPAPAEPVITSAIGYGADQKQIQTQAAQQTEDMKLSEMIKGIQQRRQPAPQVDNITAQRKQEDLEDLQIEGVLSRRRRDAQRQRAEADLLRRIQLGRA
jgi:hypothetical protein